MADTISIEAKARQLRSILDDGQVSILPPDRVAYSRDLWPRGLIQFSAGKPAPSPPDVVVWPETTRDVVRLVEWAAGAQTALVPYGGGSGVCGGAMPRRGQVVVDLKRMDRILELDGPNHRVRVQPGMNGWTFEETLGRSGLTMGHFPSSIFCSTVGGWLAARSAGQASTKYGKIEDMVSGIEVVTGKGDVIRTGNPGAASLGPDWTQIFVGSEGTLGIITEATLKVLPTPELRVYRGYGFERVSAGLEAVRRFMQKGLLPSVVRLYDEFDTVIARSGAGRGSEADTLVKEVMGRLTHLTRPVMPWVKVAALRAALSKPGWLNKLADGLLPKLTGQGCLLVVGTEGRSRLARAEADRIHEEVLRAGGRDLGSGPGEHWEKHRYSVSFKQSGVFYSGGFVDTMEVSTTWDGLLRLYEAVKTAVSPLAFIMAHFSHAYPEGCSIYFTFAGSSGDPERGLKLYDQVWSTALTAVTRAGGTISHHHGVGQSKQAFMVEEHGDSLELFRMLKRVLDPNAILNPGKMSL